MLTHMLVFSVLKEESNSCRDSQCRGSSCSKCQQEMIDDGVLRPNWGIGMTPSQAQRTLLKTGSSSVRAREQVLCRRNRGGKKMPQDMTQPLPASCIHSSCGYIHKTYTRLGFSIFSHREGEAPPYPDWQLAVNGCCGWGYHFKGYTC